MTTRHPLRRQRLALAMLPLLALSACLDDDTPEQPGLPQLGAASAGTLNQCSTLATTVAPANTALASSTTVAAGTLTVAGTPVPAHCLVTGSMSTRVSAVDGKTYAIGFEMRLPNAWNGRFFYQANGGADGNVVTAAGGIGGGGPLTNALAQGFAVLSSDAGHNAAQNPSFGLDPQARLDYGYQAVAKLTPMARSVIQSAYGRAPDRMYLAGCSNGGRHALVAAARYGDQYDGILAGDPGFNLPKAAVAQLYGVQQYATVATATTGGLPNITTAFTPAERALIGSRIVAKCDALDGSTDNMVQDVAACQGTFSVANDLPSCSVTVRDGTCLTAQQKTVLSNVFTGARNSAGTALYSSFPYDRGISGANWATWKFSFSTALDPGTVAFIFTTPPMASNEGPVPGQAFAQAFNFDTDAPKINATSGIYTESAMSFMTPPHPSDLSTLKLRGGKLMVYHGTADPVFSYEDTRAWYAALATADTTGVDRYARLFAVPGMNHCSGGPATDQFNMLDALVKWVEQGTAPDSVTATARGTGNAGGVNAEVPSDWSATRSRPLCAYPKVARYKGSGSIEVADSFSCQ